ncbi:MAG TPA: hypothetical protein VEZ14_07855 [Dehalococcoidia bacterium]|nr:hypothetical protein [Steroidobacteraceae bacterium]HYM15459.1 hypothetical protein [Dehalococcoidia bacterium]
MTDSPTPSMSVAAPPVDESLITYTNVIYALHSLSVVIGLSTFHTIVGSFVWGLPSIVAVIMNYARRSATHGTYLESHFRWQIRTFWYAALWSVVIWCVSLPLMVILVGFGLLWLGYVALAIWIIYRVARGWLALRDRRSMYV